MIENGDGVDRGVSTSVPLVTNMSDILAAISEFRDIVNEPKLQQVLMRNPSHWDQMCSAMDVIEDTSMAVRSYSSQEDTRDKGKLYLQTYGVLQALVMQQDAVFDLCKVLGSSRAKGDLDELANVRTARVSVAGHPTKKQRDGDGPHGLVQMNLHRNSFEVMSFSSAKPKFTQVSMLDLIRGQEVELGKMLRGVILDLKEADAKHKAQFSRSKIEAVFPNTLGYSFEKIYEHIRGGTLAGLGVWGVEEVRRTLDEYRCALEARGIQIDTYDAIKYHYDLLAYPLNQLENYLQGKDSEISGPRAGEIFAYFIQGHINKLRSMAAEIDKDFAS
jgi:hypothetical protein